MPASEQRVITETTTHLDGSLTTGNLRYYFSETLESLRSFSEAVGSSSRMIGYFWGCCDKIGAFGDNFWDIPKHTANTSGQLSIPLMLRKDKAKFQSSTAIEYYASLIWAFSFNHRNTFKRWGMAYGALNIVLFDVRPWRKSRKERVSNDH